LIVVSARAAYLAAFAGVLTAWLLLALALPDCLQASRTDHLVSIQRIAPPQSYRSV
jgi:hypothetical protein